MKKLLVLLLFVPSFAFGATAARFDLPVLTTTPAQVPVGSLPDLLAVTNATIAVCGYPATMSGGMCTNTITTYTDSTLATACPTTSQLTAPGTSVCISTTGLQGAFGFWYDSAANSHLTYTVRTSWGTYGPYELLNVMPCSPATPSVLGCSRPDNSTVTISNGVLSAQVSGGLQMQVPDPLETQSVVIYPTAVVADNKGGGRICNAVGSPDSGFVSLTGPGDNFTCNTEKPSVTWSGFTLPSYVTAANVTSIYAFATDSGLYASFPDVSCIVPGGSTEVILYPGGGSLNWSMQPFAAPMPAATGATIGTITCQMSQGANIFSGYHALNVASVGLRIYYTGSAPPASTALNITSPLYLNAAINTLGVSAINLAAGGDGGVTGLLPNANLANSSTTVNGQTCALGGTCTVTDSTKLPLAGGTMTGSLKVGTSTIDLVRGISSPDLAPSAYTVYGDSNSAYQSGTTCYYQGQATCYPNRIAAYIGVPLTSVVNHAVSGDEAADAAAHAFNFDSPSIAAPQPLRTVMIGTNDAQNHGAGAHEATFNLFHQALISWLTVPLSFKTLGSAGTTTGTCASDTTYASVTGEMCTASDSTITLSITTSGGPIYIWSRYIDSDTGTWTYAIDGGSPVSVSTAPTSPISTHNLLTTAPGLIRVTGIASGTHSIVFTQTNAGTMAIEAVGTPPSGGLVSGYPYLIVATIPNELDGGNQSAINAYRADIAANVTLLQADGLQIYYAPVDQYVQATTAAGDMYNFLHMNAAGAQELSRAFFHAAKLLPGNASQSQFQWPTSAASVDNFAATNGQTVPAANSFAPGLDIYQYTGHSWGFALANQGGQNYQDFFQTSGNGGWQFCIYPTGTVLSSPTQYTACWTLPEPAANANLGQLIGTTGSIGGTALTAGQSASGSATISGATTSMACVAQPSDGTNLWGSGFAVGCTITASNTVTVNVLAVVAGTPAAKTYTVRVIQ